MGTTSDGKKDGFGCAWQGTDMFVGEFVKDKIGRFMMEFTQNGSNGPRFVAYDFLHCCSRVSACFLGVSYCRQFPYSRYESEL